MTSSSALYPAPRHSGAVPNINDAPTLAFSQYSPQQSLFTNDIRRDLIGHQHSETPLNRVFFSQANIDNLQTQIQEQVFLMSKQKIDKQNEDDLKLIMRSYYLMYGKNNDANVSEDLEDLNKRVVGYASAKIYSELDFYMFYRKDIEDFAPPIANPMNTQVYGTRYGELKSFF
jgi:hypothetical protein